MAVQKATQTNKRNTLKEMKMAKVTIIALGHALVLGARGEAGGAPHKDSIWGIAKIDNTFVTFSGRRNADVFRYMTHKAADLEALKAKFADKLVGKGIWYNYADKSASADQLIDGLSDKIAKGYYKAIFAKKVNNTRKTQAIKKAALVA